MLRKIALILVSNLLAFVSFINTGHAVCPLCVVTSGMGIGLGRYLGLENVVIGFLVSATLFMTSVMIAKYMIKTFKLKRIIAYVVSFFINYAGIFLLYRYGLLIFNQRTIFHIDDFFFGTVIGIILTDINFVVYELAKKHNNGKPFFAYQKVISLMVLLSLMSVVLHVISMKYGQIR